jgi:sugar/nucleoside kinase (ribokinase family)
MANTTFKLSSIGNAILDILVKVDEDTFSQLGLEYARTRLASTHEQTDLIKKIGEKKLVKLERSGGSVANSISLFAALGGVASLQCVVGRDVYGALYLEEFSRLNVVTPVKLNTTDPTGTSVVIVTPDGERSMSTHLGATLNLNAEILDSTSIESSSALLLEGYLLSNPRNGEAIIRRAIEIASKNDTKIIFTCSEPWVIAQHRELFDLISKHISVLVCNEEESLLVAGAKTPDEALTVLSESYPTVIITLGEKGCLFSHNQEKGHVEAVKANPVDMTGAGDSFLGTFLYEFYVKENSIIDSLKKANFMAARVVETLGARLEDPVKVYNNV